MSPPLSIPGSCSSPIPPIESLPSLWWSSWCSIHTLPEWQLNPTALIASLKLVTCTWYLQPRPACALDHTLFNLVVSGPHPGSSSPFIRLHPPKDLTPFRWNHILSWEPDRVPNKEPWVSQHVEKQSYWHDAFMLIHNSVSQKSVCEEKGPVTEKELKGNFQSLRITGTR